MKKIAIIGGSGGIGSQLTEGLVVDNEVVVVDVDRGKLIALGKKVNSMNLTAVEVDISNKTSVKKLFGSIGYLDVLINCAAILKPVGLLLDNDLDMWKKTLEVNLLGTVYSCYYALPLLMNSKHGKIINFGGGGAAYGRKGHTAYASTKTAVVRFTETLSLEYPKIDINVIAPGAYKTNIWNDETFDEKPDRWGDIEELKKFIKFLVSDKSDGITGRFLHYKDNWNEIDIEKIDDNMFTLRRIDDFMFEKKK